jgi:hypothetical protein
MIVYTFNITSLKKKTVNGFENTVYAVVWEKTGYDPDGYTGSFKISTQLDVSGVGIGTGYIDYDSLTKQDVINWIKSVTNEEDVNEVIAEGIQRSRDHEVDVRENDLPWNNIGA